MKKIFYIIIIHLLIISCTEEISYPDNKYFTLTETNVSFSNEAGEKSINALNFSNKIDVVIISEESDWCTVSVSGDIVNIKVAENILFSSRAAKILVTSGNDKIEILVRQSQKYFTYIPAVVNAEAVPGPGEITIKWEEPEEDNFSHVIISYTINDQTKTILMNPGETEYTVKELLNADGDHFFTIQSVDKTNDFGQIVEISAVPGKLVAFRFREAVPTQWVPYYLKTSDIFSTVLQIGSLEYDENTEIQIDFEVDETLLNEYNQNNGTGYLPLPSNSYSLPENYIFSGNENFQEMTLNINNTDLNDQTIYALPLKIKSVSEATVSDIMSSVVIVYCVDDLAGWYTVDRLPKSGEGAGSYPAEKSARRRYIMRTGEFTWETGYLFRAYASSEQHTGSGTAVQYITIDPETKVIFIQQGSYAVTDNNNYYDSEINELNIEYLYRDWAGWWNHERMYERSLTR